MEDLENEIWKDIKDYEGLYQISNLGRVKSLPKLNGKRMSKERILKNRITPNGYVQLILCKNTVKKYQYLHRIVMKIFSPNIDDLLEVNHMDGNKLNNSLSNLEWITHKGNINHGWITGLMENVREAPAIKLGNTCKLIRITDNTEFKFKSRKELSKFLGYVEQWLNNAIFQNTNYKLACKNKGYTIVLEEN